MFERALVSKNKIYSLAEKTRKKEGLQDQRRTRKAPHLRGSKKPIAKNTENQKEAQKSGAGFHSGAG